MIITESRDAEESHDEEELQKIREIGERISRFFPDLED